MSVCGALRSAAYFVAQTCEVAVTSVRFPFGMTAYEAADDLWARASIYGADALADAEAETEVTEPSTK